MYLYIPASASEPCFTGFQGVLCDAKMQVPDAQQPPADQDNNRGDNRDPWAEDEEYFDRQNAATMEEAVSWFLRHRNTVAVLCWPWYVLGMYWYVLGWAESTYLVHTGMYCVYKNIAVDAVLCPMPVGNNTMCVWHVCSGAPILNQCPYWCPTYMTLFWYILSTYLYVLFCTLIHFLYRSVLGTY